MGSLDSRSAIISEIEPYLAETSELLEKATSGKKKTEKIYHKSRKYRAAGATFGLYGSIVSLLGFGLIPVTFGASLVIAILGGIVGTSGGLILAGSEITYVYKSRKELKKAKRIARKFDQLLTDQLLTRCSQLNYKHIDDERVLLALIKFWKAGEFNHENSKDGIPSVLDEVDQIGSMDENSDKNEINKRLEIIYNNSNNVLKEEDVLFILKRKVYPAVNISVGLYHSVAAPIRAALPINRSLTTAHASATTANTGINVASPGAIGVISAYTGMNTAARVIGIAGIVLEIIMIPLDAAILVKSLHDVQKYKRSGNSNSAVAKKIGEIASKLESLTEGSDRLTHN